MKLLIIPVNTPLQTKLPTRVRDRYQNALTIRILGHLAEPDWQVWAIIPTGYDSYRLCDIDDRVRYAASHAPPDMVKIQSVLPRLKEKDLTPYEEIVIVGNLDDTQQQAVQEALGRSITWVKNRRKDMEAWLETVE